MDDLSLDLFVEGVDDVERTQYKILGGLQRAQTAFDEHRVYPHLARLVKLHGALVTVLAKTEDFRTSDTGRITGINWEKQTIDYEWPEFEGAEMSVVEDLIRWALPHIRSTIDEGADVYENVEENLALETVGILPTYVQEGYLMVPNREADALHVLRYTLSIFAEEGETHRALRTTHCKTVEQAGADVDPSSVKLQLLEERRDLPAPATYFSSIEVDVPYRETLLPVVKRRLVRQLAREMGEQ